METVQEFLPSPLIPDFDELEGMGLDLDNLFEDQEEEEQYDELVIEWADDILPFVSENCIQVLSSYERGVKNLLLSGNRSCGKSNLGWWYAFYWCCVIPGFQVIYCMNNWSSIPKGPIKTLKKMLKHGFDEKLNPFKLRGGEFKPTEIVFDNGSIIEFAGVSDSGKAKSKEPCMVIFEEATEVKSVNAWATIAGGTLGGRAKKWFRNGRPFYQKIAITNPDSKLNWVWKRFHPEEGDELAEDLDETKAAQYEKARGLGDERADQVELYDIPDDDTIARQTLFFTLKDNPYYSDNGIDLNLMGQQAWNELVEEYEGSGVLFDRYVLGKWVAAEGAVFTVYPENLINLSDVPPLTECILTRVVDWGSTHPSVCLWIARHKVTGNIYVYREWRQTHSDLDRMGAEIESYSGEEDIEGTIVDNDEQKAKILRKYNIPTRLAKKHTVRGQSEIINRILLIQTGLRRAKEGKDEGLYIVNEKEIICNDGSIVTLRKHDGAPTCLPQELMTMEWEPEKEEALIKKDRPIKKGDDAADCLGYYYTDLNSQRNKVKSTVKSKRVIKHL